MSAASSSLGSLAKRGAALGFLRAGVLELLLFPTAMFTARLLTPAEFGLTTAAMFFIQLSQRLSDLGFTAALVRAKDVTEEHYSTVFAMNVGVGLLAFGVLVGIAPSVAAFYGIPETGRILPVAALTFLITPFGAIPNAILERQLAFRQGLIVQCLQLVTFSATSVLLAWFGFSFWSLVYAGVAAAAVQTFGLWWYAPWRPSLAWSSSALHEVLSFAVGVHTKRLLEYTAANVDNLVVGKFMGMTALGLYDKAFSTMNRVLVRMSGGGPSMIFRIFSLIQEDPERFRRAYGKVVMSACLLAFPAFGTLAAVAPQLIAVLFGDQWSGSVRPFQILCLAGALKLLNSYASAATQASGRIWPEVWRHVSYVGMIVAILYMVREYGPSGAAVAVLTATAVMFLMMQTLLRQVTGLGWLDILRPLVPAIVCACGTAGLAWFVQQALLARGGDRPWPSLGAALVAALAFYAVFVLFAPIRAVRMLVHDVSTDMLPAAIKRRRLVTWYLAFHNRPAQ